MGGLKRIAVCGAAVPLCLLVFTACGGGGAAGPGKPGENSALDDYGAGGSAAKRVGSAMMKFVGGELASTAVGGAAGIAMDAALEAIFGNDTERIEAGMEECNQKLDQVIEKLDEISKQLDDALQAIAESRDDIEALNQELAIKEPIDIIQSDYRNLEQMSRWASDDDDSNDPTSADAKELADTIRSTAKHDIPLQLDRMHSGIVGDTGSGKGALKEWTDQIRNGVRNGDDLYDESFSIDTPGGEFLGEYGVGVSETIGVGEPKKVAALEVWLFDKNDIKTATKVLMSEHAYNDPNIRARLEPKGDLHVVKPGEQVLLETETLQLLATVVDLEYGVGALPPNSYFERITLELAIWPRSGNNQS